MDTLTTFELLTLGASIIGVYVKLTQEVGKLKARVIALEKTETEVKALLGELLNNVQEIKLLLAEKGIR
jgi:hypothetical protein